MPVDINALLEGVGIEVPAPGSRPRATRASQIRPFKAVTSDAKQKRKVSSRNSFGSGAGKYTPTFTPTQPTQEDDDSAWSTIGDIFAKALDVVDTPRAFVQAAAAYGGNKIAEAITGVDDPTGADLPDSWSDVMENTWSNKGFGSYLHDAGGTGNKWLDRGLGFGGDVILDPLTHSNTAMKFADEAMEAAFRSGSRKAIATALTEKAVEAGIEKEASKLIANAARKGRGALTKKGITESGLTAEQVSRLGIGQMSRELFGMSLPGSTAWAEATETLKGSLKEFLGGTRAAKAWRGLRVSDRDGTLQFVNAIRNAGDDFGRQADAVRALASVSQGRLASRKWATVKVQELLESDLGKQLKSGGDALVRDTEAGGVRTALNDWLDELFQDAKSFGVKLEKRENYVPHLPTAEALKLGRTDDVVQAVVDSLQKVEGFQKHRLLDMTIDEANAEFAAKHPGVKLFETDPAKIAVRYLNSMEEAINRATINNELVRLGAAKEIVKEEVTRDYDKKAVAEAAKRLSKTEKLEKQLAKDGISLAEHQARLASDALKSRISQTLGRITEIDTQLKDVARRKDSAEKAVALLQSQADALQRKHDGWVAIVKRERGPLRREAEAALRRVRTNLDETIKKLEGAKADLDFVTNRWVAEGRPKGMVAQAKGFAAETKRLAAERAVHEADHVALVDKLDQLKLTTTPPGAGPLLSDAQVAEASERLAEMNAKIGRARSDVDIVENVYDIMLADKAQVVPMLQEDMDNFQKALAALGKKKDPKSLKGMVEYAGEIGNNLRLAKEILEGVNDPVASMLAQLEAAGAMVDARRIVLGYRADSIRATLDTLRDPKFHKYFRDKMEVGFTRITETHQIPDWIDQALTAKAILNDPKKMADVARFYDRALNVLKGYMIARPGFVVRNAYSSLFNVYLEGGLRAVGAIRRYERFYRMFKNNPEGYLEEATSKWGLEEATLLDKALGAQMATGFGQAADEFHVNTFAKLSLNPFSSDFAPIRGLRKANEVVEEVIRGGHAYDVLKRGGSESLAVETLEKWHFNYEDLTSFDQKMKRVMPFWTFFSRNLALQASEFPRILPKLNRTYFNAKRNLEVGEEPDEFTPQYFDKAYPLRIPGTTQYLFPDLPTLQVVNDVGTAIDSKGRSLIGQTVPPIKLFADTVIGDSQSFSGVPFNDKYRPSYLPDFLPGVDTGGLTGEPVWTDRTQYAYESLFPTLGQANRLGDTTNGLDNLLSWLGVSTRKNTDKTRKSERMRQERALEAELKRTRDLEGS